MRGKWLLASATVILLAIAAGAVSWLRQNQKAAAARKQAAIPAPAPVFTGPEASLSGKIRARNVVPVPAPVDGTIEFLPVDIGQQVYEGELLARIKNTGLETEQQIAVVAAERAQARVSTLESSLVAARLESSRARAEASRAQSEMDRTEKLFLREQMLVREGATPRLVFEKAQKEFEAARAEFESLDELGRRAEERVGALRREIDEARKLLETATRDLEAARDHLAAAEIHSPVDGLVVARTKSAGEEVTRDIRDLFQIAVDLTSLEAVLEPEPPVLARIQVGQEATVQAAESSEGLPGKVRAVDPKTGEVVVEFTTPDPSVRPGLTAHVRIKLT